MKRFIRYVRYFAICIAIIAIGSMILFGIDTQSVLMLLLGVVIAYGTSCKLREDFDDE